MPRKQTDAEWIAEASRILDKVDAMDPNDPTLAPWQTENWRRKGEGMLRGLKPIAVVVLLALGGCTQGWLEDWAPSSSGPRSVTYIDGRAITTYHYPAPDPLGSVHEFRPDIYYRMFPR